MLAMLLTQQHSNVLAAVQQLQIAIHVSIIQPLVSLFHALLVMLVNPQLQMASNVQPLF